MTSGNPLDNASNASSGTPPARQGMVFIVAAPSGAGKSTLVNALLSQDPQLQLSVSYTTRAPRPAEQEGREYHFVDEARFLDMLARGDFLEHALVHGNRYGTSRSWIDQARAQGRDIVLEIDWQGAQQVRRLYPDAVSVFILPPSLPELEHRLRARAQDSEEVIRRRMANARDEIAHVHEFDFVIINEIFDEARRDLAAVFRASRLKSSRQIARHPAVF
jgi:guanylate kinase